MRPINKRVRQLIMGGAVIFVGLFVWWDYVYSPLHGSLEELSIDLDRLSQEHEQLTRRIRKLSGSEQKSKKAEAELARFSKLMIEGESLEEINAFTQVLFQQFLEKKGTQIRAYKELAPANWLQYPLGRVQIQLDTTMPGISDILFYLENLKKVVRIERLSINYKRSKDNELNVVLHLGTPLFKDVKG